MADFYVKTTGGALQASKYLTNLSGTLILNPNFPHLTPPSAYTIFNAAGNQILNTHPDALIIPANWSYAQSLNAAHHISTAAFAQVSPVAMVGSVLAQMTNLFRSGGALDLQTNYNGTSGPIARPYIDSTSFLLGVTTREVGLPLFTAEVGGGIHNFLKWIVSPITGNEINVDGTAFLSERNATSIPSGYDYQDGLSGAAITLDGVDVYFDFDGESLFKQNGWNYNLDDLSTEQFESLITNPLTGQEETLVTKLTLLNNESTTTIEGKSYFLTDVMDTLSDTAQAVGEFISNQAETAGAWFSSPNGAQVSFASWLSQHMGEMIDGNLSADEAIISLAKHLGRDYVSDQFSNQITTAIGAKSAIEYILEKEFGITGTTTRFDEAQGELVPVTNASLYADSITMALGRMTVDFALSGFDDPAMAAAANDNIAQVMREAA